MADVLCKSLCGISDEAGISIEDQVRVQKELGWTKIELRSVDSTCITNLPPRAVRRIASELKSNNLKVVALDTGIGGWNRSVKTPFGQDVEELRRASEIAHLLGCDRLRIMSFPNVGLTAKEWREEALSRIASLVDRAVTEDVVLLHENCCGWASQGAEQTADMLNFVNSPRLRLLFDIGNPVVQGYDGLGYLDTVAQWVEHVHVKDAVATGGHPRFTLPSDGDAHVESCIRRLLKVGYKGVFSIEPHLVVQPPSTHAADPAALRAAYTRCGRRLRAILASIASPNMGAK